MHKILQVRPNSISGIIGVAHSLFHQADRANTCNHLHAFKACPVSPVLYPLHDKGGSTVSGTQIGYDFLSSLLSQTIASCRRVHYLDHLSMIDHRSFDSGLIGCNQLGNALDASNYPKLPINTRLFDAYIICKDMISLMVIMLCACYILMIFTDALKGEPEFFFACSNELEPCVKELQ